MKETNISVIIKVTNACNLKCRYCYDANYLERKDILLDDVACLFELLAKEYSVIDIIWHGGEPMLMGVDFYQKVLIIQEKYLGYVTFVNKMQTNGTLIDNEWADFFVKNDFRIGISYDGGNCATGREKQELALKGRKKIIDANGKCGVVTVINSQNVNELIQIYENYKEKNINAQFNFVFPYGRALEVDNRALMVPSNTYVRKMNAFFDYWLEDGECNIRIDPFITYLQLLKGVNTKCITGGCLYKFICMDSQGDIYPCGRIIMPQYYLGNIHKINSIKDVFYTEQFGKLLQSAISRRNKCIQSCLYYQYCRGGCNSDAIIYGDIEVNNHFACDNFRGIMKHIILKVEEYKKVNNEIYNPTFTKAIDQQNK